MLYGVKYRTESFGERANPNQRQFQTSKLTNDRLCFVVFVNNILCSYKKLDTIDNICLSSVKIEKVAYYFDR